MTSLKSCQNFDQLSTFLEHATPRVRLTGGRRFGSVCMNDICKQMQQIPIETEHDLGKINQMLQKIQNLETKANALLSSSYWPTRKLTQLRQWIGNWKYDRAPILAGYAKAAGAKIALESGIEITPEIKNEIATQIASKNNYFVLSGLKFYVTPDLTSGSNMGEVNKIYTGNEIYQHVFNKMLKARALTLIYNLEHIIIPNAKTFDVQCRGKIYTVLAQQNLPQITKIEFLGVNGSSSNISPLDSAIQDLTTLALRMGWQGIDPHSIKFTSSKLILDDYTGNSSPITLLKLCKTKEQVEKVMAIVRKHTVPLGTWKEDRKKRLQKIEENTALQNWYKKTLKPHNQPLNVDINTLDLALDEKKRINQDGEISFREVAEAVIAEINRQILNNSQDPKKAYSAKKVRSIVLDETKSTLPLFDYRNLSDGNTYTSTDNHLRWIHQILTALEKKEHIFKLKSLDSIGYHLQA